MQMVLDGRYAHFHRNTSNKEKIKISLIMTRTAAESNHFLRAGAWSLLSRAGPVRRPTQSRSRSEKKEAAAAIAKL
ncbi:hypothetical protein J27TS7_29400 [Paenibacillus dendritiformis]|nr:hypothetical protein J27TS7_29400 [Paenibacillus dendritiformis]